MVMDAFTHLLACIVIAMVGGFAASELWSMDFVPATAGCLFLLSLAQATRP